MRWGGGHEVWVCVRVSGWGEVGVGGHEVWAYVRVSGWGEVGWGAMRCGLT